MPGTDRKLYGEVPCAHNDPIGGSFKFARLKLLLDRETDRQREREKERGDKNMDDDDVVGGGVDPSL